MVGVLRVWVRLRYFLPKLSKEHLPLVLKIRLFEYKWYSIQIKIKYVLVDIQLKCEVRFHQIYANKIRAAIHLIL